MRHTLRLSKLATSEWNEAAAGNMLAVMLHLLHCGKGLMILAMSSDRRCTNAESSVDRPSSKESKKLEVTVIPLLPTVSSHIGQNPDQPSCAFIILSGFDSIHRRYQHPRLHCSSVRSTRLIGSR